ncbi:MAG: hypothetical protein JNK90_05495 [Planctomycetaceae bacterium]|nr:hypothetical protein [Planctomycetaceae bacterium]
MDNCATRFDAPASSDFHAELRSTAWMGGSLVEGRYLLGMLLGTNLFRFDTEGYLRELNMYISTTISDQAAAVFCNISALDALIPYLRMKYELETDLPRLASPEELGPPRNERLERAIEYLLNNLHASLQEIANHLGTTEKQVVRLTDLKWARELVARHDAESTM